MFSNTLSTVGRMSSFSQLLDVAILNPSMTYAYYIVVRAKPLIQLSFFFIDLRLVAGTWLSLLA
jgi:hypothetical protein